MQDPYEVLGVSKSASAKDIKAAYRKLAKKHHPDQNPTDPKAKDRFAALNQAYEIVGDEKNRTAFDRGEIDASGKQRFQGFEGAAGGDPFGGFRPGAAGCRCRRRGCSRCRSRRPRLVAAISAAADDRDEQPQHEGADDPHISPDIEDAETRSSLATPTTDCPGMERERRCAPARSADTASVHDAAGDPCAGIAGGESR